MKRRIFSFFMMLVLVANLMPLSGCKQTDESNTVTRGEWVTMLSESFGMDSYTQEEPYYSDVPVGTDIFPYVQAAFEWDVLSIFAEDRLDLDKTVTRREIASTAAIASGFQVSEEQLSSDGVFNPDASIEYAIQCGILDNDKDLSKNATAEECETALVAARDVYLNTPIEEKVYVATAEDIVDLSALDNNLLELDLKGNHVTIPEQYAEGITPNESGALKATIDTGNGVVEVGVGEVFVTAPTAEKPAGVAYKVSSIEEVNGEIVFTTETPTLYDLYEELDVHKTVSVDASDIIWLVGSNGSSGAQGVVAKEKNTYHIDLLSGGSHTFLAEPLDKKTYNFGGYSYPFEVGSGSFKKNWSNHNSSVIGSGEGAQALEKSNFVYDDTPSIDDFNGSTEPWSKELQIENKFSGGYKITGNISINALTVTSEIEYKRTKWFDIPYGVERAGIQINSDISSNLTLEGNLNERLHIATVPVPIAATGLSVDIDLYLYAQADGSLVVTATLGSNAKVEYAAGKLKHSANSGGNATVDASIKIDFGAELAATLDALGIVKIVDIGAKAGGELTASAHVSGSCQASEEDGVAKLTYQESLSIKADLYIPTASLYTGGSDTLISSLGLQKTWDILSKENGAKQINIIDYEWVFWEETVITDEKENATTGTSSTAEIEKEEGVGTSDEIDDTTTEASNTAGEKDGIGASDEDRLDLTTYVITINKEAKQLELDLEDGQVVPDVVWTSDDPSVARVDETGLVTPVSAGYTLITASLRSDPSVYVKCAVYVEEFSEEDWEFLPSNMAYSA